MPKPYLSPPLAARNAAIHAAEATFRERAADIVSLVLRRAHGGQAARLLDSLGAPVRARADVTQVRKFADIEADLAQALAALGLDDFVTVAPRGPGGILMRGA
jgi:hypothetical protein